MQKTHNSTVSFGNCMVRIPGSFNSKCLQGNRRGIKGSQVKLVQKWNGFVPKLPIELLNDFKGYLADLKISKLETKQQKTRLAKRQYKYKLLHGILTVHITSINQGRCIRN
jgi:hypothetical protein